ncbi:allophanate hydrolase [Streptacidiphilus carbonis]|uniref:allophanate hydrolase n=1 Tax=Streptacidiphilus carbonis TaxID=105422 RepID=UPI0005AA4C44|nr:allophanate hydrolase [Streptacidiphilus carbonis]
MTEGPALARVRAAYRRIAETDRPEIWIDLRPQPDVEAEARALDARAAAGERLPLAGTALAVKGNIDVAGLPTTAGCPGYAYRPEQDAGAVARLRATGAIVLGTTNLDQFATGLVGTRSPYGAVRNAVDPTRVSGGSSSGSAVAVALGIADLALGTDTAGSGRVPAALNGVVGLKPTYGAVPTSGVVPACRSLDCVSVFARTVAEAELAHALLVDGPPEPPARRAGPWRIAVPDPDQLGELDPGWDIVWAAAVRRLADAGAELLPLDLTPFSCAAELLYQGAFVAERYTAVGAFVESHAGKEYLDPVVAAIVTAARDIPAHRLFVDQERLARLRAAALAELGDADALLLPTTPGHPTLDEVAADPVGVNSRMGRFTNSTNLFGLCALAVPAGTVGAGLPFGVMLIGRPHTEDRLGSVAGLLTGPAPVRLAVVGAHLSGEPLNGQLLDLGARLVESTTTAPEYRLHALATSPSKPGLVRVAEGGAAIQAEVWELPAEGLGRLLAALPEPMALGRVRLADGSAVTGFLCEGVALAGAPDITAHGGWRAYRAASGRVPGAGPAGPSGAG